MSRILVVDDDEVFAQLMQRRLSRQGHQVEIAMNGTEALDLCLQFLPEYILLDLKIGQESGLSLIPSLLNIQANTRIVILTGYGSITSAVEAMKRGAVDYLTKPIDSSKLNEILCCNKIEEPSQTADNHNVMSLQQAEWEHIQKVLDENDGNISATAKALKMHRRTLQRKLQKRQLN